jgi:hypothetical protein
VDEIAGNWLYMLERLPPEKQRSLRQKAYHKLRKKVLYPVYKAFVQVRAAIDNETRDANASSKSARCHLQELSSSTCVDVCYNRCSVPIASF